MLRPPIRIGPRTIKTAAAVIIAMVIVQFYGTTTSRLTFAMLGAMAAVEPTFNDSLRSCVAQIVGVLFGSLVGVLLLAVPMHPLLRTGIGIVLAITLYNTFRIRFSPSLPCLIVLTLCVTPDIQPMSYALGRIWDTASALPWVSPSIPWSFHTTTAARSAGPSRAWTGSSCGFWRRCSTAT